MMSTLDEDIVFVRTEMGQKEAYDPASDLPRVLRTLLFSIDGRSTAGNYAALLPNFGDVFAHLGFLHEAGYLRVSKSRSRRRGGAASTAASDSIITEMPSTQFEASAPPRTVTQDSQWQVSRAPSTAAATLRPSAPSSDAPAAPGGVAGLLRKVLRRRPREHDASRAWGQSQQFATSMMTEVPEMPTQLATAPAPTPTFAFTPAPPPAAPAAQPLTEPARLQAARDLMIDFLHLYLPAIAHEASLSIDALHTRDQMLRSLPDYSQLVSRTGDAGAAHLAQLHLTLGLVG
jgi:hypothetical protein